MQILAFLDTGLTFFAYFFVSRQKSKKHPRSRKAPIHPYSKIYLRLPTSYLQFPGTDLQHPRYKLQHPTPNLHLVPQTSPLAKKALRNRDGGATYQISYDVAKLVQIGKRSHTTHTQSYCCNCFEL